MKKRILDSLESCNTLLQENSYLANGKNFRVNHLYATSAKSRWPHENIWAIYLAKPQFAWMALWMAMTSRNQLKKRQIRYIRPEAAAGDYIGRIEIFNPQNINPTDLLCQEAYLYLFDPEILRGFARLDISNIGGGTNKQESLLNSGFKCRAIRQRGKHYDAFVYSQSDNLIVDIDEWQAAIVSVEKIVPNIEVILTRTLIEQLATRIQWLEEEVGEDYIAS